MPNKRAYITNGEKCVLVRLHEYGGLNAQEIADSTGRGLSTVYRTLALHRNTGLVSKRVLPQGRSRKLDPLDVLVCIVWTRALMFNALLTKILVSPGLCRALSRQGAFRGG